LRYFIDLSYNGTHYHGWQVQPNAVTVQATLNKALSVLLKSPTDSMGAGRTDTGVHAVQMVAHFDTEVSFDREQMPYKLNAFLPKDIAVNTIKNVHEAAHARFDAISRSYIYKITTSKNVFEHDKCHCFTRPLDVNRMNEASRILRGYKDFECFSRLHSDVKTFLCQISHAQWIQTENHLEFKITADRFLRNMVRAIVGTMLDVGIYKTSLDEFKNIIESKDRSNAGASAPAKGLYLTEILYPNSIYLDD
jgi:tRNA pseudouridine38-40 synthase